jgi:small-conductance mechanosensitive channel
MQPLTRRSAARRSLRDVLRWAGVVLALGLVAGLAHAADTAGTDSAQQVVRQSAPLKLANRTIIVLRGPIAGYTAEERVKASAERIERALESEALPQVTLEEMKDYGATRILVGGQHAFLVTKVDIDEQAGETTQVVARETVKRLETAIKERRLQESPPYLATRAAFAGVATVLSALILWLLYRISGWAGRRLSAAAAAHSQKIHVGGVQVLDGGQVLLIARRLAIITAWTFGVVLAYGWLTFVLVQFPYTRPWGEQLEGNLADIARGVAIAIVGALPGLLLVVVIFLIARLVIRFARLFFDRVENGRLEAGWLDADTAPPTRKIFSVIVWLFALAMAYPYLPGAQTEAFKGISVIAGLMVTIGASSVVGQAFSGLMLTYTRAFRSGDYVRIGESEGTVTEVGIFATRIRTGLGEELTLPNSSVMSAAVKNYSRAVPGTGYIVDTTVTIGYSTPWRQVEAMLTEAARRTGDIVSQPAPIVRQTALSDFYVEYRLAAYTPVESPARRIDVLNRLHGNIQDVFNEYGVQIMSPHYMMDPAAPQVVPKDEWHAAPARRPE